MADEKQFSEDINFARQVGERMASFPLYYPYFGAKELLADILNQVNDYYSRGANALSSLSAIPTLDYIADLDDALRLRIFAHEVTSHRMLVFTAEENEFKVPPLFDMFNPRARKALSAMDQATAPGENVEARVDLQTWANQLPDRYSTVAFRDEKKAFAAFGTLFAANLLATLRALVSSTPAYVPVTVTCRKHGYQLESYPQYNFSPVVFGSNLTWPVTDTLKSGHYHFQGWFNNTVTPGGGVHQVGPGKQSVQLRGF